MFLTSASEIHDAIQEIVMATDASSNLLIAVAFWGIGAENLLPNNKRVLLICNLSCGGTNPDVIRHIAARHQTKHLPNLHAKVVIGKDAAVVGSANMSAQGLALLADSRSIWREAGVLIERAQPEYEDIRNWFFQQWQDARGVDEDALVNASFHPPVNEAAIQSEAITGKPVRGPGLSEAMLFSPDPISGGDRIRMAADWLNKLFNCRVEPINSSNVRIPAFVANLLWTLSGRSMATAIENCPMFLIPDQIIHRATEPRQPKKNLLQIEQLLSILKTDPDVPPAVQFWADQWLAKSVATRNLGKA